MRARLLPILLVAASATGCLDGCFGPLIIAKSWTVTSSGHDPGEGRCTSDRECPDEGWLCDEGAARCYLPCELDSECPTGSLCCVEQVELRAQRVCVEEGSCSIPTCPPEAPLAIDRACHMRCAEDADCPIEGEACCDALPEPLCMTSETCARALPCEDGTARDGDGFCLHTCSSIAGCYDLGAYCGFDLLCHGTLAGERFNACAAALAAPPMEPSAPLLYEASWLFLAPPAQGLCARDGRCGEGRFACGAALRAWDPEGDLPTGSSELFDAVALFVEGGGSLAPYAIELSKGDVDLLTFEVCVDSPRTFAAAAVTLRDRAGHASNALCLEQQVR